VIEHRARLGETAARWSFFLHDEDQEMTFAGLPFLVQVFGRRHDELFHALWRPASKKRQGTKSREIGTGGATGAMGI